MLSRVWRPILMLEGLEPCAHASLPVDVLAARFAWQLEGRGRWQTHLTKLAAGTLSVVRTVRRDCHGATSSKEAFVVTRNEPKSLREGDLESPSGAEFMSPAKSASMKPGRTGQKQTPAPRDYGRNLQSQVDIGIFYSSQQREPSHILGAKS
jgi:hypothetical protein